MSYMILYTIKNDLSLLHIGNKFLTRFFKFIRKFTFIESNIHYQQTFFIILFLFF